MLRLRIYLSLLLVSFCTVVCDAQSQPIADFDMSLYRSELIYHDTTDFLLLLVNDDCVFMHFPVDLAHVISDPYHRADFLHHMLSSFHHSHVMPSSLDAVRDKYADRLADFHCTDKNIHEAVVCDYRNDWHRFEMSCYQRYDDGVTFTDAQVECQKLGGYLVEITSTEENDFVFNLPYDDDKQHKAWIGVARNQQDQDWTLLSDHSPLNYTNWIHHDLNPDYHCAYIAGSTRWHVGDCGHSYGFICERSD